MNALIAVFITLGIFVGIGAIVAAISRWDWGKIGTVGCFILFWILPIPLMIAGVVTNNILIIILAEVIAFGASLAVSGSHDKSPVSLILVIPTAICVIYCILWNQVAGAVITTIAGIVQLAVMFA